MTHYENIPNELKQLNQWVCTRSDSKVPMKAFEPEAASSTNPETWSSFDTALEAVSEGHYDYCGFVFNDNGYVGIDIDDGYDQDGFLSPLAAEIIGLCKSYTEKSKAGEVSIFCSEAHSRSKARINLGGVEIYKALDTLL